jgi:acyl-CoA synthetase (AMP-forming)/AMP-acid ligase II
VSILSQIANKAYTVKTMAGAGVIRPTRPDKLVRLGLTLQRWGPTLAAGAIANAVRFPDDRAVIDELGTLTWREVDERSNALANALSDRGVVEGDGVAILCRNHRGFIDATLACMKLGTTALYLNTSFAAPQITDVVHREDPVALIFDEEFTEFTAEAGRRRKRFVAWSEPGSRPDDPRLDDLIRSGDRSARIPPEEPGRVVILTSGTTGTPKGAQRKQPDSLDPVAGLFAKIPLRAREPTLIAAPMFHSWGMAHFSMGLGLTSAIVLRRRFDPEDTLATIDRHRCTALAVVPVMLQRTLELPPETFAKYDLSSLRVIAASGSALPGELATKVMDRFGDVLYNLYGSTEVAWATIATPEDLRAAPGTAGRPPRGTVVRIVDDEGRELPRGRTGRIFVGNEMVFEGYTGGGNKQVLGGLMSSGDVGHFDEGGRLFIDGRDDEMIVSGGENVFPREVEDLLAGREDVHEVAVVGVDDEQFGQRLKAFVVPAAGHEPSEDELKEHVRRNLARFKVPREVVFIDALPRNATGKVLKRELQQQD